MGAKIHDYSGVQQWTAPTGGVTEGTIIDIQDSIVLPLETATATNSFEGLLLNAHIGKKLTGVTKDGGTGLGWTQGQAVYYDISADKWTATPTGNNLAAIAAADATAAATTGDIIPGCPVQELT